MMKFWFPKINLKNGHTEIKLFLLEGLQTDSFFTERKSCAKNKFWFNFKFDTPFLCHTRKVQFPLLKLNFHLGNLKTVVHKWHK